MKETISKKILKKTSVSLIAIVMVLSAVIATANTSNERVVSLTRCAEESNPMIFGGEITHSDEILLWDNGDPDGRDGLSSCYWSSYPLDREVVDDFDINDTSWTVGGGHFRMVTFYGNTAEFIDGVNVFFYEDTDKKPSVIRYAERVTHFNAYNTGDYYFDRPEIAIDVIFNAVELATGKWWVCFQPVLDDNGFWLTATGYGENIWLSHPDFGHPKWTEGYKVFDDYYDASFKLFKSSPPPETPQRPEGPTEGVVGVDYTFLSVTTDPKGGNVSYLWEWDDGTPSEWTDFYGSGQTVTASHSWTGAGDYNITVKAKDIKGRESNWSYPSTISIVESPILEISNITGGLFKVGTVIKNTGGVDAIKVDWNIILGGGVILIGKETSGSIVSIPAGDEKKISSSLIFGFGNTMVTVSAEIPGVSSDTKDKEAFVLLFFIKILDE